MVVGQGVHGVRMRIVKGGRHVRWGFVRMRMVNFGEVEGCDCGEMALIGSFLMVGRGAWEV